MIELLLLLALECPLAVVGSADVYAVVTYAHEDPDNLGMRYTFTTETVSVADETATLICEGHPIGAEWFHLLPDFTKRTAVAVKSCGDTAPVYPHIFSDGFEMGNTVAWSAVIGGEDE